MATIQEPTTTTPGTLPPDPRLDEETSLLLLRLSPEMNRAIEGLMDRTGLDKADVINMAVGLLKAASDATSEGKRFGIAAEDQELEVEFTGL